MDTSRMRPAERRRLEVVALCARINGQRRRSPRGSFRRADYADQLDRALDVLHRAVEQDEQEAARSLAGRIVTVAPSRSTEEDRP